MQPWQAQQKLAWFKEQVISRSYQQQVVSQLQNLPEHLEQVQYGTLSIDPERYPLLAVKSRRWQDDKPTVLITGGVHGYETSGVHGALAFIAQSQAYQAHFNLLICPCVSPWGYETINRWNPQAIDPNRSFIGTGESEESQALIALLQQLDTQITIHLDLHETTDTDNSVFRPALAARDAKDIPLWEIPDGYYLVGDSENPCTEFQRAIIDAVAQVTHIAAADSSGRLIGEPITQPGVINYPTKALGLCAGMTQARYVTTTEVYPDSPKASAQLCEQAQLTTIFAALDYYSAKAS